MPLLHPMVALTLLGAAAEEPTAEQQTAEQQTAGGQTAGADEFINRRRQVQGAALTTREGLYLHYCAHCHGEQGKGDGRLWTTGRIAAGAA